VRAVDRDPAGGVRTIVGTGLFDFGDVDGTGDVVRLQHPQGLAVAPAGRVLVCDSYNDSLRWLDRAARRVETWVRGLHEPGGVALGARGAYVADTNAHRLVVADWRTGEVHQVEVAS
jgi:DNA-binding beta-propeller fold protein YncE